MNGVLGGTGFINKAMVNFSQRFLSILIQTNQLVYNIRQSSKLTLFNYLSSLAVCTICIISGRAIYSLPQVNPN